MATNTKLPRTREDAFLEGLEDVARHFSGEAPIKPDVVCLPPQNPKQIRENLSLSQSSFSGRFGLPLATIKNWEQGRRAPDQPTNVLLYLISQMPDRVVHCLRNQEVKSD